MPKLTLEVDYETMDQITVENLKETHALILKYEDHNEEDDAMLRSIEDVLKYYLSPQAFDEWAVKVAAPMWEKLKDG